MKVITIGVSKTHLEIIRSYLAHKHEVLDLPETAGITGDYDERIEADDAVISMRFQRQGVSIPKFSLLHVPGAGLDRIDMAAVPKTAWVCNVFEHEIPMAEYVLLAMLNHAIRFDRMTSEFSNITWAGLYRGRMAHGELHGKTLGILGYGRIGQAIAERARAFGMKIVAITQRPLAKSEPSVRTALVGQLHEVLPELDALAVTCPLTDETKNMIGETELALLGAEALLINVARAEIIAEEALFNALSARRIGGAVLDVWYRYPATGETVTPPSRFPFSELPNAYCTPHVSAWTDQLPMRRFRVVAENIDRLSRGEPLINVVRSPLD